MIYSPPGIAKRWIFAVPTVNEKLPANGKTPSSLLCTGISTSDLVCARQILVRGPQAPD